MSNYQKEQRTTYPHLRDEKAKEEKIKFTQMAGISQHDCPQPSNSILVSVKCTRGRRENIFWESSSYLALVL